MFFLCNENLNNCRTRLQKLFKGGNYSREETISGNTVLNKTNRVAQVFEPISLF